MLNFLSNLKEDAIKINKYLIREILKFIIIDYSTLC
ncbi:MAG: hypothetical protein RLZZ74_3796 [Cyanobacteriota bacterium]|jgi:hypothetical protein